MNIRFGITVIILVCITNAVRGQVSVVYHANGSEITQTFSTGLSQNIPVVVGAQHDYIEIFCEPNTADLGSISVTADAPGQTNNVWILITRDDITYPSDPTSLYFGAGNWAGLTDHRGKINIRAGISQNLTGSILLEDDSNLVNVRVNGQIAAMIWGGSSGYELNLRTGSIASQGDIFKTVGRIGEIVVSTGAMLGDVKALAGSIGRIDVVNGDIGSSTNYVTIEAAASTAGYHIDILRTQKHMFAYIDCNTATPEIDGAINTFQCGSTAFPSTSGDFYGSIRLGTYAYEHFYVGRDLYGTINIGSELPANAWNGTPQRLLIGRSFKSGAEINLTEDAGLHGFIKSHPPYLVQVVF